MDSEHNIKPSSHPKFNISAHFNVVSILVLGCISKQLVQDQLIGIQSIHNVGSSLHNTAHIHTFSVIGYCKVMLTIAFSDVNRTISKWSSRPTSRASTPGLFWYFHPVFLCT